MNFLKIGKPMKKSYLFVSLALWGGFLLSACSSSSPLNEEPVPLPGEQDPAVAQIREVTVVARDVLPSTSTTRTAFELQTDRLSFSWAEGDKIGVVPQTSDAESQVGLTISGGAGQKSARFTGGGWALRSDINYVAYYPFDDMTTTLSQVTFSYDGQQQTGNASLAHLGTHDFMYAASTAAVEEALTFDFKHLSSIGQFNLTVPAAGSFTSLTLRCNDELFPHTATLSLTDGSFMPADARDNILEMSLTNVSTTAANEVVTCYLNLPPIDLTGHIVSVILRSTADRVYQGTLVSKTLESGRAYRFDAALTDVTVSTVIPAPGFGNETVE